MPCRTPDQHTRSSWTFDSRGSTGEHGSRIDRGIIIGSYGRHQGIAAGTITRAARIIAAASLTTIGLAGVSTAAHAAAAPTAAPGFTHLTLATAQYAPAGVAGSNLVLAPAQTGPVGPTSAPSPAATPATATTLAGKKVTKATAKITKKVTKKAVTKAVTKAPKRAR